VRQRRTDCRRRYSLCEHQYRNRPEIQVVLVGAASLAISGNRAHANASSPLELRIDVRSRLHALLGVQPESGEVFGHLRMRTMV
jgi:hypothetical protein